MGGSAGFSDLGLSQVRTYVAGGCRSQGWTWEFVNLADSAARNERASGSDNLAFVLSGCSRLGIVAE